ncbi:unnamed protein product [Rotaria sordida]|uniref:[Histone H3]-trimethyl-L-lysine(9) demethylase n=1 Tax=Rotaria sordida TaxID=392033 RepID=A0A815FT53_9BILA|nr:unnamed protein product [Rotaria sordida]CAF1330591.1 unnamed protein product [Rotaria sordida]
MISSNLEVPVFYPTYDEFKNFSAFVSSIEARGAHKIGLAKIVPPKEWIARKMGYKQKQIFETSVENPIKQEVHGKDGVYSVFNIQQRSIKLSSFQRLASSNRYASPASISNDLEKLEKKYWQSLTSNAAIYGADVSGSFYDENQTIWNINHLGTILDDLVTEQGMKIQGVNTAYLYFGMWKASFAWHTEDMELYSINYLHFGAPKQWYIIPPSYGRKFEQFAASRFPSLARRCPAFLRHKMTIISPTMLIKQSIPYSKMTQYEGEFMITFPYGYHSGFNYGFNCAESTNFALERWIEYGKHSIKCTCREDMVKISMDAFVYKYQPELYEDWCRGINLTPHPEDIQFSKINKDGLFTKNSSKICIESLTTVEQLQHRHHKRISDERYACIFRNLAKFDKQKQLSISQYSVPLIRAALYRGQFKMNKNLTKNSKKLLCLTANLVSNLSFSLSNFSFSIFFNGLKQAGKYREHILNGLWNYQLLNIKFEQLFNQWLCNQSSYCSICYFFIANKSNKNDLNESSSSSSIRYLLKSEVFYNISDNLNELLQCSMCHINVHRDCYESICLALNVDINDEYDQWLCQRCTLKKQISNTIDDRCSACLLRGGLLLYPRLSSSFIHAICSIYQAYQSSYQSNSCHYCWSFCPLNYRRISTHSYASCSYNQCTNTFHITCGLISGCTFQIDSDHSIIDARCHLHAITSMLSPSLSIVNSRSSTIDEIDDKTTEYNDNLIDDRQQHEENRKYYDNDNIVEEKKRVPIGTRVLINDTKEQKLGQVIGNELSYHYSVDFGDDTYSHDMLAEDILDSDPSKLIIGSNVRIKWTDGTIYTCKYLGRQRVLLYHIKINNETRQLQRNEFSLDNQLPSPPPTPSANEYEFDSNRRSLLMTSTKRQSQQQKQPLKRKRRRRLLLSSSSSSDES